MQIIFLAIIDMLERINCPINAWLNISGGDFCASKANSYVIVRLFYSDAQHYSSVEEEAYPIEELLNELVAIVGGYFGIAVLPLATIVLHCMQIARNRKTKAARRRTVISKEDNNLLAITRYFNLTKNNLLIFSLGFVAW